MFAIDEQIVKLGIIGPFAGSDLETVLRLATNEGEGELEGLWSIDGASMKIATIRLPFPTSMPVTKECVWMRPESVV